jgi:cytochrome c oxidase subunit 4
MAEHDTQANPEPAHASHRRTYLIIFGLLFLFTVVEVAVSRPALHVPKVPMVLALVALALTKAGLVAFFFMHLRHELRALRWTVLLPFSFPALYALVLIAEASWRLIR